MSYGLLKHKTHMLLLLPDSVYALIYDGPITYAEYDALLIMPPFNILKSGNCLTFQIMILSIYNINIMLKRSKNGIFTPATQTIWKQERKLGDTWQDVKVSIQHDENYDSFSQLVVAVSYMSEVIGLVVAIDNVELHDQLCHLIGKFTNAFI